MMSNKLFVLFFSLISCHVGQSQNVPGLAIERVREDIKHSSEEEIPEDLDELADRPIEIFYLEDYALAHINNKTGAAQGYLQQSYILTYQMIEEHWQKKSVIPYNYDIQLSSATELFST